MNNEAALLLKLPEKAITVQREDIAAFAFDVPTRTWARTHTSDYTQIKPRQTFTYAHILAPSEQSLKRARAARVCLCIQAQATRRTR